jgi:hypothetical protein
VDGGVTVDAERAFGAVFTSSACFEQQDLVNIFQKEERLSVY